MEDEIKAIRVPPFLGLQCDRVKWSEKYQGIAAERGYLQVMLGKELVPSDSLDIDEMVSNKYIIPDEDERKQKHLLRKLNQRDTEICNLLLPSWLFNLYLWQKQ